VVNRERWHDPHWLYRMFDSRGRLLYIGLTQAPRRRITNWRSAAKFTAPWFNDVCRIDWQKYENKTTGWLAERKAVAGEQPVHNKAYKNHMFA
jgi:hypothetical protein